MSQDNLDLPPEVVRKLKFIGSINDAIILARKESMSLEEIVGVLDIIKFSTTLQSRLDFEKLNKKINN